MHTTNMLGAGIVLVALGWFLTPHAASGSDGANGSPVAPVPPPIANGHYALVVEGDRDLLTISRAVAKADPWAGVPKGAASRWTLTILAADGARLAAIPLDLAHFDTDADRKSGAVRVEGCIVHDPRIVMLVNVPRFAGAAAYTFSRRDDAGVVPLGAVTAARVEELAGGGR